MSAIENDSIALASSEYAIAAQNKTKMLKNVAKSVRLPVEVAAQVAAFAFHVGYY